MTSNHDRTSYLWLRFSGLPAQLGVHAWTLLETLCALDTYLNISGDTYLNIPIQTLKDITGLTDRQLDRAINRLRKSKLVKCFIADHPSKPSTFSLHSSPFLLHASTLRADTLKKLDRSSTLPTPLLNLVRRSVRFAWSPRESDLSIPKNMDEKDESNLQTVCDLYYNHFGCVPTVFILDRLRNIARRHSIDTIREAFDGASRAKLGFHTAAISLNGRKKKHAKP